MTSIKWPRKGRSSLRASALDCGSGSPDFRLDFHRSLESGEDRRLLITTSRRFKCVIQKWVKPLAFFTLKAQFIPLGNVFGVVESHAEELSDAFV